MGKITIFDCGCVITRPKESSCNTFGTRWRIYLQEGKPGETIAILLKCRDCGRRRSFSLKPGQTPTISYMGREDE